MIEITYELHDFSHVCGKGKIEMCKQRTKDAQPLVLHDAQGKWHKHLSVPVLHQSQAHMLSLSTDSIPHLHAMVHAHQNGLMYVKMMVSIIKCNEMCLHCFISESIIQSASLFEQVGSWRSSSAIISIHIHVSKLALVTFVLLDHFNGSM